MSRTVSRRNVLSLLGGAGLAGSSLLLGSCGGGGGSAGSSDNATPNICALQGVEPPVVPGTQEMIATDLLSTTLSNQAATFRNANRLYPTRPMRKGTIVSTLQQHSRSLCGVQYTYSGKNYSLNDYFTRNRTAGMLVLKNGQVALEQYAMGNGINTRWTSFSIAKSVTSMLVGAALREGRITSLDDTVQSYLPSFMGTAYGSSTIRQLLTMTSGMAWNEKYEATGPGTISGFFAAAKTNNSINVLNFLRACVRAAPAGTVFNYSTGEAHLLGVIVATVTNRNLSTNFAEKIATPMGMETDGYWILDSNNGLEMGGNDLSMTLRDYARLGQFFIKNEAPGYLAVLPQTWFSQATQPSAVTDYGKLQTNYPLGYGYQWWLFPTGQSAIDQGLGVHDGAFTAQGIYGQFLYIHPKEETVVVVWSAWPLVWDGIREFETYTLIAAMLFALR